jgi:hypothetical protein
VRPRPASDGGDERVPRTDAPGSRLLAPVPGARGTQAVPCCDQPTCGEAVAVQAAAGAVCRQPFQAFPRQSFRRRQHTTYAELGADFLERLEPQRLTRQLVKRLEALGNNVTLEPCPAP